MWNELGKQTRPDFDSTQYSVGIVQLTKRFLISFRITQYSAWWVKAISIRVGRSHLSKHSAREIFPTLSEKERKNSRGKLRVKKCAKNSWGKTTEEKNSRTIVRIALKILFCGWKWGQKKNQRKQKLRNFSRFAAGTWLIMTVIITEAFIMAKKWFSYAKFPSPIG